MEVVLHMGIRQTAPATIYATILTPGAKRTANAHVWLLLFLHRFCISALFFVVVIAFYALLGCLLSLF